MRSSNRIVLALMLLPLAAAPAFAQARGEKTPAAAKKGQRKPGDKASGKKGAKAGKQSEVAKLEERRRVRPPVNSNTCAVCHGTLPEANLREPAELYAKSVHVDARIGCVGCHNGDAEDPTVRGHATKDFLPRPAYDTVIDVCGGCHKDARFVRQINPKLQVDQAALYDLSVHAKLARTGDAQSPTCVGCHGSHDIQRSDSPTAKVNRRNVSELCGGCHADKDVMAPYQAATDQLAKWKRSRHAEAFAEGSATAPTCTGCHGPHAGASEAGSTPRVCGACHEEQLEFVRQSPHAKPFEQLGMSECTPCHGQHDIVETSWLAGISPDSSCGQCHARDKKVRLAAEKLSALLRDARKHGDDARKSIASAEAQGLVIRGAKRALEELSTEEARLHTKVHTLDQHQLKVLAGAVRESAARATQLADVVRAQHRIQRRGYYIALGLLGFLLVLLQAKLMQVRWRRRRSGA